MKKACGYPTLLPDVGAGATDSSSANGAPSGTQTGHHHLAKPSAPPSDTEMLRYLVNIENSRDFYAKIVNR